MTPDVTYCLNSLMCGNPINAGHDCIKCADCGASLLIQDQYRLIEILHKDSADPNKVVYRAIDEVGNDFVLKIIDYPKPELGKYLEREYNFLRQVGQPFPQISDNAFFQWIPDSEQDFFYVYILVLPFINGQDSFDWIKSNGIISEEVCVIWIKQILEYLEKLSDMSFLYRDMKPQNIVISDDNTLNLIDFGSVLQMTEDYLLILQEGISDGSDVKRGTQIFTFGYTPPEQLRGYAIPQSDFYALGRTAIYWLSGKSPSDLDRSDSVGWGEFCKVSKSFEKFIDWLTQDQASSRPLNARAIREYLDQQYPIDLEREHSQRKKGIFVNPKFYFAIVAILGVIGLVNIGRLIRVQSLYNQGIEAYQRTQYRVAADKFKHVLNINPSHGGALYFQGLDCQRLNKIDCASKKYQESIQQSSNSAAAEYQMGVLQETQGEYKVARSYYQKSLKSNPENPEVLNRLARLDIRDGNFDAAQSYISIGLRYAEDTNMKARLISQKGRIYYLKGEWDKAEQFLDQAIKFNATAESVCLLPSIKKKQNEKQNIIDQYWYNCFYAPALGVEGQELKSEILRRAFPSLFSPQ